MRTKHFLLPVILCLISVISFQCKKEQPPVVTPRSELIIGSWQTTEMREDGVTQPAGIYATYLFNMDSTVTYVLYDEGGDVDFQFDDIWVLSDEDKQIDFQGEESVTITSLTATQMTIEYTSNDPFSGTQINHSDDFEKQ